MDDFFRELPEKSIEILLEKSIHGGVPVSILEETSGEAFFRVVREEIAWKKETKQEPNRPNTISATVAAHAPITTH